jgi:hypothetical protein
MGAKEDIPKMMAEHLEAKTMDWLDKFKKMNIEKITLSDAMAIITILFMNFSHDEKAYNILAEFTKSLIKEHPKIPP